MRLPDALRADLDRDVDALGARYGDDLVSVVLFGSWARAEGREESDLDVLVVTRGLPGSRLDRYEPLQRQARGVSGALADRLSLIASTPEAAARVKPYHLGMTATPAAVRRVLFVRFYGDDFDADPLNKILDRLGAPDPPPGDAAPANALSPQPPEAEP